MSEMEAPMDSSDAQAEQGHAREPQCANCGATLLGAYCHACGQHAHNPLKSFKHAVEDVFESFWHLDGRVFRTIRDICVPGRAASAYLAGKRVGYLPPLRVFVILSLFTFFLAHLAMPEDTALVFDGRSATEATPATGASKTQREPPKVGNQTLPEYARTHPVQMPWAPERLKKYAHKLRIRAANNVEKFAGDGHSLATAWLSAVPTALFVMLPVFALLLTLFYWRSPFGYLEHLVVALYSHAYLLLVSAGLLLLVVIGHALQWQWLLSATGPATLLMSLWCAVYLYLSQKRVYGEPTGWTVAKYLLLGVLYSWLVSFTAAISLLTVFVK